MPRRSGRRKSRADLDRDAVEAIEDLARGFDSHVLVAPNPDLDAPVVATAWTRKLRLQQVDLDALRDFAIMFRQRGPEDVACPL